MKKILALVIASTFAVSAVAAPMHVNHKPGHHAKHHAKHAVAKAAPAKK
jgi:hypothetical protein